MVIVPMTLKFSTNAECTYMLFGYQTSAPGQVQNSMNLLGLVKGCVNQPGTGWLVTIRPSTGEMKIVATSFN